jgi:hypothetical protein
MAFITRRFTLPAEKFRLEEINLPEELAASLAGRTVTVKVLPEVPSRTLRIGLDHPQAVGVPVPVDDDGTAWNDDWPARVIYTDPDGREWRLPRHWLSEGVSPVIAASRYSVAQTSCWTESWAPPTSWDLGDINIQDVPGPDGEMGVSEIEVMVAPGEIFKQGHPPVRRLKGLCDNGGEQGDCQVAEAEFSLNQLLDIRLICSRTVDSSSVRGIGMTFYRPHPHEVEGHAGKGRFYAHFLQTSQPEATHPALFFQDSDHRFLLHLAPAVAFLTSLAAQLCWPAQVLRRISRALQPPSPLFKTHRSDAHRAESLQSLAAPNPSGSTPKRSRCRG